MFQNLSLSRPGNALLAMFLPALLCVSPMLAAPPPPELPQTEERAAVEAIIGLFDTVEKVEKERRTGGLVIHLRGRGEKANAVTRLTLDARSGKVVQIHGNAAGISNEEFRLLAPLKELRVVSEHHNFPIRKGDVCDGAGIAHLAGNARLEEIALPGSGFSNAALAALAKLPQVKKLGIWHVNVDDAGFAVLRGHPGLESVRIAPTWAPKITDKTLEHLSHCPNLKSVALSESYVTWEHGLRHLVKLKGTFQELNLETSVVAPEDLERFRAAMPGVVVKHAGLPAVGKLIRDNFKGAARQLPKWVPQELLDRYVAAAGPAPQAQK